MWHGIMIDVAFDGRKFVNKLDVIGKKVDGDWTLLKIGILDNDVERSVQEIQKNMKGGFYSHIYSKDGKLIVIFKKKIIRMESDKSTWKEAVEYGKSIGIPEGQLDFYPCRFEDEEY